jgi:dTDP-4-dehydrorhamnose reductase
LKLMITGAGGMLGRDLARAGEQAGHEIVRLARDDLDITDADAVERSVATERPDAVVNSAAWTDVDGAEDDLQGAMDVNATGAANLAQATADIGCKLVYPSTDYVFDGTGTSPYVESDEPRPLSVYGQSKLAGEVETAKHNPRHFIVRASWLFGTGGRNFVETMLTFARDHEEVVVVKDQVGCPTYTGHLADGIVRLLEWTDYGVHHMAGSGECSWYEFALEIFDQANLGCRVLSATTEMLGRKAPRPSYAVLASEREPAIVLPHWREGLAAFLAERAKAPA